MAFYRTLFLSSGLNSGWAAFLAVFLALFAPTVPALSADKSKIDICDQALSSDYSQAIQELAHGYIQFENLQVQGARSGWLVKALKTKRAELVEILGESKLKKLLAQALEAQSKILNERKQSNRERRQAQADKENVIRWTLGETLATKKQYQRLAVFSPDGSQVLTRTNDQYVIWSNPAGRELKRFGPYDEKKVGWAVYSADGTKILALFGGKQLRFLDSQTGEVIQTLPKIESRQQIYSIRLSPNAERIVVAVGKAALILNASTGEVLSTLQSENWVMHADFSPDGQSVATACWDYSVSTWNAKTGRKKKTMNGHISYAQHVSYSPDGQKIISSSADGSSIIWDAKTGKLIKQLIVIGHNSRAWVHTSRYSPDGLKIVTAGNDLNINVWDAMTFKKESVLQHHKGAIHNVEFSPNGDQILSVSDDETAQIWERSPIHVNED